MLKSIIGKPRSILVIWLCLAFIAGVKQHLRGGYNNYLIFKNVFWNTLAEQNLYLEYPNLYFDSNHYGPFFSIIIAPFAMLPDLIGVILWISFTGLTLYYAIRQLPLKESQQVILLLLISNELFTSYVNTQFNPVIAATIILAYVWISQGKEFWAALVIMAGTFIKLYSVVGFAFFFFSKNKSRLLLSSVFWALICLIAPMFLASPDFIIQSYQDWFNSLTTKNELNIYSLRQDISIMGFVRRVTGFLDIPTLYFLIPGLSLFAIPYLKIKQFTNQNFQLLLLSSVMLFVCLFSTGTESSTYIIAFTGACIWFLLHKKPINSIVLSLFIFTFILTSLSPTDLFPRYARDFVLQYALKALPCILVWLYLMWELITFKENSPLSNTSHQ
ncbi:DUF2029 domain-containing protein [Chryseotalea sanaruensis]|uniref:DUF2029 domain-containing protein n=1 Tax=Chryseotalea sanaruensis TaxID=2482724 RepID=A0A401UD98_9BACT|nr:glycosyltransferase family 87 protein [Chryseotalea sanaruensis]GCC52854.1 DUF2029 domain-containing protein [Chryseotalea sanaruensis]